MADEARDEPGVEERRIAVRRTARYYVFGGGGTVRDVWFVLHGYGQLARRFLRPFRTHARPDRLFVAPEALSRHYHELSAAARRVGAVWMTSEDRLAEIDDYVAYLDALAARILEEIPGAPAVHVLGFSQGAATAGRWAARGRTPVRRLVAWGGEIPDDVPGDALRSLRLTLVAGRDDHYATPARQAALGARLDAAGLPYDSHTFDGGHRLDGETLARVIDEA